MRELNGSLAVDELPIGMALGSPSQAPIPAWPAHNVPFIPSTASSPYLTPSPALDPWRSTAAAAQPPPTRKPSKWKLFGMFRAKPAPAPPQPFYKLQPEPAPDWLHFPEPPAAAAADETRRGAARGRTNSERRPSMRRAKPRLARAMTAPTEGQERAGMGRGSRAVLQCVVVEPPTDVPSEDDAGEEADAVPLMPRRDEGSLLAVDIPSIHMERYSIMFSSFLDQKKAAGAGARPSSALLARRQATLDRLRSVDEAVDELVRCVHPVAPLRSSELS